MATATRDLKDASRTSAVADGLSARELEVLGLASAGRTNADIAKQLNVSIHAVKFHLASVYRKLGVANRTEAAVVFLESGGPFTTADAPRSES